MTTVTEIRADTDRFRDEIHTLVLRNTRLQREIMTLNTARERAAAEGAQMVQELTEELQSLDDELRNVRAQCHSMRRALSSQRTDVDRMEDQISSETSMSSTRFRRMSTAILGNGGHGGKLGQEPPLTPAPSNERARGISSANAVKRRGSVMMRLKSTLSAKKSTSTASTADDSSDDNSDDNRRSVDIDEVNASEASPTPGPVLSSTGSNKSLSSSTSSFSSSTGSASGRPPRINSAGNVLHYKPSDEKKSVADSHKEHLSNFRRSSRSSRRLVVEPTG